jgi:hypothetical protein
MPKNFISIKLLRNTFESSHGIEYFFHSHFKESLHVAYLKQFQLMRITWFASFLDCVKV